MDRHFLVNSLSVKVFLNAEYQDVCVSVHSHVEYRPLYDSLTRSYILCVYADGKRLGWHWTERFGIVGFMRVSDARNHASFLTTRHLEQKVLMNGQSAAAGPLTRSTPDAQRQTPDARRSTLKSKRPTLKGGRQSSNGKEEVA